MPTNILKLSVWAGIIAFSLSLPVGLCAGDAADQFRFHQNSQWSLQNPYLPQPAVLNITAESFVGGEHRMTLAISTTYWNLVYLLVAKADGIYFSGFQVSGGDSYHLTVPAMLFPLNGAVGGVISTEYGSTTVVSMAEPVTDAQGRNWQARHYRVQWTSGFVEDWYLVDGQGAVQYMGGSAAHFLKTSSLATAVPQPAVTYRPSSCPATGVTYNAAANQTYSDALIKSKLALLSSYGGDLVTLDATWAGVETSPGNYDFSEIVKELGWAATYNQSVMLTLRTVDTLQFSAPADLSGKALDDPAVLARFEAMIRALSKVLTARVRWVNIANEVDPYLQMNPASVPAFQTFFKTGYSAMKAALPATSVSFTHAYQSVRYNNNILRQLTGLGDHLAMSYYPMGPAYNVSPVDVVAPDFGDMLAAAGSQPMLISEVGYPSASSLGSSQAAQSTFFAAVLAQLRQAGGRIVAANMFLMNDMSRTLSQNTASYYGSTTTGPFVDFFSTLGLFDQNGVAKTSLSAFRTQLPQLRANNCQTPVVTGSAN